MNITINKNELTTAVNTALKAVPARSTLPALEGLLITAELGGKLTITGYDLELGIDCTVDADVREPGVVVVNGKMFGDITKKLPDSLVTLKQNKSSLDIESGVAKFQIRTSSVEDYPTRPAVETDKKVSIAKKQLQTLINGTVFAASTDDTRPTLKGIFFKVSEGVLEVVGIDGYRLAYNKVGFDDTTADFAFNVPSSALFEVSKTLQASAKNDGQVEISCEHNNIAFVFDGVRIVSRLITGDFMNYKSIMNDNKSSEFVVERKTLLEAIDRACLVSAADDTKLPINLKNADDGVEITAKSGIGELNEVIGTEIVGETFNIAFNPKYLLDILKAIPDDEVKLYLNGAMGPCTLRPVEDSEDQFLYLVLPMRQ